MLTEWLATVPTDAASVAWLSLDHRDNDPALFWTYVVTAMQTAVDGVGAVALQLLASASPATEAALAALLNELDGLSKDLVLVLDDYHLIEAGTVTHAREALSLAPPDDDLNRAAAGALAEPASWTSGDLPAAHAAYTESVAGLARAGFLADVLGCCSALGDVRRAQGASSGTLSAPTRRPSTWQPGNRAPSRCGEPPTCTSGSRECCSRGMTSRLPRSTWPPAVASGNTTGCRRTRTGGGS